MMGIVSYRMLYIVLKTLEYKFTWNKIVWICCHSRDMIENS